MSLINGPFKRFHKDYTVKRVTSAGFQNGYAIRDVESTFTVSGSMQPLSANELNSLEEGRRKQGVAKFYSGTKLQDSDKCQFTDVIEFDGSDYEVVRLLNWQNDVISHYKYLIQRVEVDKPNATI